MKLENWTKVHADNMATDEFKHFHKNWMNNFSAGIYWDAGVDYGKMDSIAWKLPSEEATLSETAATAPREYNAGYWMGYLGLDLKADFASCYPEDQDLADLYKPWFDAIEAKDFKKIEELTNKINKLDATDLTNCKDNKDIADAFMKE